MTETVAVLGSGHVIGKRLEPGKLSTTHGPLPAPGPAAFAGSQEALQGPRRLRTAREELEGRGPRAPGAGEGARDSPPELSRRARPGHSLSMDFLGCLGDTNRSKTVRTQSRLGPRTQAAATLSKEIKATCGRISGW